MVHWLVAREILRERLIGWFFRVCWSIPVAAAGTIRPPPACDPPGARRGLWDLPRRANQRGPDLLLPGRPGAALIALRRRCRSSLATFEGSPYDGTSYGCLFMTARVRLVIGRPIDLSPTTAARTSAGCSKRSRGDSWPRLRWGRPSRLPAQLAGRFYNRVASSSFHSPPALPGWIHRGGINPRLATVSL